MNEQESRDLYNRINEIHAVVIELNTKMPYIAASIDSNRRRIKEVADDLKSCKESSSRQKFSDSKSKLSTIWTALKSIGGIAAWIGTTTIAIIALLS